MSDLPTRDEAQDALLRVANAKVEPQPLLTIAAVVHGYDRKELMTEQEWKDSIDYESAMKESINIVIARKGYGPYAEELADVILRDGHKIQVLSNYQVARRIVDAALGDSG